MCQTHDCYSWPTHHQSDDVSRFDGTLGERPDGDVRSESAVQSRTHADAGNKVIDNVPVDRASCRTPSKVVFNSGIAPQGKSMCVAKSSGNRNSNLDRAIGTLDDVGIGNTIAGSIHQSQYWANAYARLDALGARNSDMRMKFRGSRSIELRARTDHCEGRTHADTYLRHGRHATVTFRDIDCRNDSCICGCRSSSEWKPS